LETRLLGSAAAVTANALAPPTGGVADTPFTIPTITGDASVDVTMVQAVTVSGVVRDGQGSPMPGVNLSAGTKGLTTDSQGRYSMALAPGSYTLTLSYSGSATYANFYLTAALTVTTDRTLDLTVPTHRVTYRIVGPSGNPVPGARVNTDYYFSSQTYTLAPGVTGKSAVSFSSSLGTTNSAGTLETRLLGSAAAVTANALAPTNTTLPDTPFTIPTIDGDRTLVISFSKSTVDQTPPTVTCGALPTDWRTTNASATCTASDAGVGLRNAADASFEISTTVADDEESGNATAGPRQVCDLADNCTDAVASGAKVDRKAPVVSFDRADGPSITKDAVATLGYTCTDGGSGLATCTGSQPSGQALDTSTTGDHSVTVATSDNLGNEHTATFHYTVTAGPTPPPDTGGKAKLSLSSSVSPAEALPGDTVTYTLTATNGTGAGEATGTVVSDVLPDGVTFLDASEGCTNTAGTVRCELDTIAAGTSKTATIRATVDPIPMRADPNTAHQVLEQKAETDLRVERGETRTATASCPTGYLATDGGIRLDAVDQGGSVTATSVPASGPTADGSGWTATLRNDNPGAALAKVTVACLARTTVTGEHQHDLVASTASAAAQPIAAGATTVEVACPAGQTPFAPSYALSGGGVVRTSQATGSAWTFVVDSLSAATGDFAVGCLGQRTTTAAGHYHVLGIDHRAETVTVPAGQTIETQLTCADQAKGIVASRRIDAGLVDRGTDPRAKIRSFRLTNPTDHALTADLGLTCVDIRTSGEPVMLRIANTATVATATGDETTTDDSATATFTAYGDGWALLPTGAASVAGSARSASVGVAVRCASDCVVSARLVAIGRVPGTVLRPGATIGSGRAVLGGGDSGRVTLRATGAAAKALTSRHLTRAKIVITTSDGATTTRTVTLRR
ncbi:carboxypeptidase regulatory-like domain-containing protein, partial [Nocardioides sp.]|uniref:carboxypeptidase regulatory-like domain-containing protein n=1 Tax=Nocardioides sp. TaxID=35761 RepID=UPI0026313223